MTFPQIKSTAFNIAMILVVIPAGAVTLNITTGHVHGWHDLAAACNDGFIAGVSAAIGWIAMKSPLAAEVHALLTQETQTAAGDTTKITLEVNKAGTSSTPSS